MSRILRPLGRWPVLAAAIVLVIVAGGGVAWAKTRGSATAGSTTQYVAAKVATVTQTVAASGTIAAAEEADLDFGAAGRVTKVLVATGDKVRKGQALARIGTAPLTAAYDAAKAQREAAVDTASDDSGDSSAQRSADAAQVTAATTAATEAKQALAAATLRSTIAGTVTSVDLTVGQQVSPSTGSSSSGAGTTTGTSGRGSAAATASTTTAAASSTGSQVVVQSAGKIVNGTVDDTDVQQVKTGQAVAITPDGATVPVSGVVRSVGSVPSSSSGVVTFPVVVRVTGHPTGVYAGASATMTITTKHVSNVLEIPTLAITYAGSTASVEVQQGGSTVKRTVTIGATYGLESQVLSGVQSGEKVQVTIPSFGGRLGRGGGTGFGGGGGTGTGGGFGGGGGFTNGGGFGGGGGGFTNGGGFGGGGGE